MNALDEAQLENYLAHYGVLGKKWGVRKAESRERIRRGNHDSKPNVLNKAESSNSESRTTRQKNVKRAVTIGLSAVAVAAAAYATYKVGGDYLKASRHYDNLLNTPGLTPLLDVRPSLRDLYKTSSGDQTIARGHEFIRKSKVMETSIDGRAFASATKEWANNYATTEFGENVLGIKALKDIKIPSYKTQVDNIESMFSKDDLKKTLDRTTLGKRIYQDLKLSKHDLSLIKFENFASNWWTSKGDPDVDTYFQTMTKRGYSATKDYLDGGDAYVLWNNKDFVIKSKS